MVDLLYGYRSKEKAPRTVVTAAHRVADYEMWYQEVSNDAEYYHVTATTTILDHLGAGEPEFAGYIHPVYLFYHDTVEEQDAFFRKHGITELVQRQAKEKHDAMIELDKQMREVKDTPEDRRSIADIHNLDDDNDKWDARTEEEKEAAKSNAKQSDDLRKRLGDSVTGSSFDPNPGGSSIVDDDVFKITGVKIDKNRQVSISGVKSSSARSSGRRFPKHYEILSKDGHPYSIKARDYVFDLSGGTASTSTAEVTYTVMVHAHWDEKRQEWAPLCGINETEEYSSSLYCIPILPDGLEKELNAAPGHWTARVSLLDENIKNHKKAVYDVMVGHGFVPSEALQAEYNYVDPGEGLTWDDIEKQLTDAQIPDDKIKQVKAQVNDFTDFGLLHEQMKEAIRTHWSNEVLKPVLGVSSNEEALEKIKERLDGIAVFTSEEKERILKYAEDKLNAPKPKPGDYKFALNQDLTESQTMGGAGTPVINVAVNSAGPNRGKFNLSAAGILFETYGFEFISNGYFAYNKVSKDDSSYEHDVVDFLKRMGFVEDPSIIPQKVKPNMSTSNKVLSPEDFAKALAGDGTSTMSGTDSFGKHKVGVSMDDYAKEIKPGVIGDVGVVIDQGEFGYDVDVNKLPEHIRGHLDTVGYNSPTIWTAPYTGMKFAGSNYIFALEPGEEIVNDYCYNIRLLGGTKMNGAVAQVFAKDSSVSGSAIVTKIGDNYRLYTIS